MRHLLRRRGGGYGRHGGRGLDGRGAVPATGEAVELVKQLIELNNQTRNVRAEEQPSAAAHDGESMAPRALPKRIGGDARLPGDDADRHERGGNLGGPGRRGWAAVQPRLSLSRYPSFC